jgi:hypothetical protein
MLRGQPLSRFLIGASRDTSGGEDNRVDDLQQQTRQYREPSPWLGRG